MGDKFVLFISGVPQGTLSSDLIKLFTEHGFNVRMFRKDPKSAPSEWLVRSGYCLVQASDKITYKALLRREQFDFTSRKLMVSPYLQGAKLHRTNAKKNRRRIVVKHVPSFIPESDLVICLEQTFGKIEAIYKFKDSPFKNIAATKSDGSMEVYSVMLQHPIRDPAFTILPIEIIPGTKIYAEKFSFKQKNKTSCRPTKESHPDILLRKSSPFQDSSLKKFENLLPKMQKSLRWIRHSRGKSLHKEHINKDEHESTKRSRSLDLQIRSLKGYCRATFLEELQSYGHHIRPTTKSFQCLRQEEPAYLSTFQLRNTWVARTNFRLNKMSSSRGGVPTFLHH